jgi:hypothetical protein
MQFVIEQATVTQAKAKIAIVGPAGAGKTYTALITAREMGERILVIDTENGTSAKYANEFKFDILNLPDYKLVTYIAALEYAIDKGYDVVIIDSLSHAWAGPGGALEHVDMAAKKFSGNKFSAWGEVTPLHNKLISVILAYPTHLIATMRMKMDYILTTNEKGKQAPKKVGLGIVQRDGMEYEFDVIAEMTVDHYLTITKTRCSALDEFEASKPDGALGIQIKAWLTEGAEAPVWPDGWHPTKVQFFERAKDQFGWSLKVIAEKLKAANFNDGYKPEDAADMWRALNDGQIPLNPGGQEEEIPF